MYTTPVSSPMISIGPRVRKSPFFDATMRWGARAFTVYNHMYMPTHYGDPVAEYWSLVRDVTLWDVSCQRQIIIRGPEAKPFMELLTPRDLSNCPSHRCLYVILTDEAGGIVNDAVLMHMREDEFWLSPGDGDVICGPRAWPPMPEWRWKSSRAMSAPCNCRDQIHPMSPINCSARQRWRWATST